MDDFKSLIQRNVKYRRRGKDWSCYGCVRHYNFMEGNATRIAASPKVDHPNENVTIIKNLMPEMMKIANGLEEYLKSQEPEDDDVPF